MKRWKTYYPNPYSAYLDEEIEAVEAKEYDSLLDTIKRIADVACEHDTGERQYRMSDMEYILKQCEKVLPKRN